MYDNLSIPLLFDMHDYNRSVYLIYLMYQCIGWIKCVSAVAVVR